MRLRPLMLRLRMWSLVLWLRRRSLMLRRCCLRLLPHLLPLLELWSVLLVAQVRPLLRLARWLWCSLLLELRPALLSAEIRPLLWLTLRYSLLRRRGL